MSKINAELEVLVQRVGTALEYIFPGAEVKLYQDDPWRYNLQVSTFHNGCRLNTNTTVCPDNIRDYAGYFEHLLREIPTRHVVEITHAAVAQAKHERFSSRKSEGLTIPRGYHQ